MAAKRSRSKVDPVTAPRPAVAAVATSLPLGECLTRNLPRILLVSAMLIVAVTRALPMYSAAQMARPDLRYQAANSKEYPYLIGQDSYSWVRKARNYAATGSPCDEVLGDDCRDRLRHAPVGSTMPYADSMHIRAIAWLHRVLALFDSQRPIAASAFWLQVLIGTLGVIPAWLIGYRLAGVWAAFFAAILTALNPNLMERSLGADNDIWNIVLPLFAFWAMLQALESERWQGRLLGTIGAAAVVALQAQIWSGWGFTFLALGLGATLCAAQAASRLWIAKERAAGLRQVGSLLLVAGGFAVATWLLTYQRPEWSALVVPEAVKVLGRAAPMAAPASAPKPSVPNAPTLAAEFPNGMRNIGELQKLSFAQVGEHLGGWPLMFGALIGLLLLLLPRVSSSRFESIILSAAALFVAGQVFVIGAEPTPLGLSIVVPMLLILGARTLHPTAAQASATRAALLLTVWLGAALYQSQNGQRYLLLAVVPVGLAFAGGAGYVVQRLQRASQTVLAWIVVAAVSLIVGSVAHRSFEYARHALPRLHDAWWDSLVELRDHSPPDSIVHAWWSYGYWIEYAAERGVGSDGSSVTKRIAHWLGRSLMATDEKEAVGLLRMLSCGSDAGPEAEGRLGAYERLQAAGLDGITAHDVIVELASLDRQAAEQRLADRGYSAEVRAGILSATHCAPRPAYLMLSDRQIQQMEVRYQGNWDMRRALIARRLRHEPEVSAVATMVGKLGFDDEQARSLYKTARALRTEDEVDRFIASSPPYITIDWVPCKAGEGGRQICKAQATLNPHLIVDSFQYPAGAVEGGTVRFREGSRVTDKPPETLLVADGQGVRTIENATTGAKGYAILIDTVGQRALFGAPPLMRSLFTRLQFLDNPPLTYFEKIGERRASGERVSTWRIHWP